MIWMVLTFLVLLGLVGLALDTARVLLAAHELQNAADAAALAAAAYVRSDVTAARQQAVVLAAYNTAEQLPVTIDLNTSNDAAGDIVVGRFYNSLEGFEPGLSAPNAVKVTAHRTDAQALPLIFGPIFGVSLSNISRSGVAKIGGGTGAGIIALDKYAPKAFDASGTFTLDVKGGDVQVNSNDATAANIGGGVTIEAPNINVDGGIFTHGSYTVTGDLNANTGYVINDPLAYLPAPTYSTTPDYSTKQNPVSVTNGQTVNLTPGYYSHGITMNGGEIDMAPGIYVLGDPSINGSLDALKITGGKLVANGVMFYILAGSVTIDGNAANVTVTPPDPSKYSYPGVSTYENLTFFQARTNTSIATINGGAGLNVSGTLYFPSNELKITGSGSGFGNQLIANTLDISGTGTISIVYNGKEPAMGNRVYLVK